MSQVIGENGYGWLARRDDNPSFTYTLGDASHAYDSIRTPFWIDRMEKMGIAPTPENGLGDPGVERFRRHFLFLRPDVIVIYDELEARKPVRWSYLLRSPLPMTMKESSGAISCTTVSVDNTLAAGTARIFSPGGTRSTVSDEFFSPAENWRGKAGADGTTEVYAPQWHADVETEGRSAKHRFLTVITLAPHDSGTPAPAVKATESGWMVGRWNIEAELDGEKPAALRVVDGNGDGVFYNTSRSAVPGSTVTVYGGKARELVDEIPVSVRLQ
jgi:hypothetical protein